MPSVGLLLFLRRKNGKEMKIKFTDKLCSPPFFQLPRGISDPEDGGEALAIEFQDLTLFLLAVKRFGSFCTVAVATAPWNLEKKHDRGCVGF